MSKDYDFSKATEGERLAHDLGYEKGWAARMNPDTMDLQEIREEMLILVQALERMIEQERQRPSRGRIEFEDAVIDLTDERGRS